MRIARLHLPSRGPVVVGEIVAPAVLNGALDQLPEIRRRFFQRCRSMRGMQVENDAHVPSARPRQEAFVVRLDEADGSIDHVGLTRAKVLGDVLHEIDEGLPENVDLADHLGAPALRAQAFVEGDVIFVQIFGKLMGVGPVDLAVGRQIIFRVRFEGPFLVGMGKIEKVGPIRHAQLPLLRRDGRLGIHRPVRGKNAARQEMLGPRIDIELEIAVHITVDDPLLHRRHQLGQVDHLHAASQFGSRHQPEFHFGNQAEKTVASDRQSEELPVFFPAASEDLALRVHERERLDVGDHGLEAQPSPMGVRGERPADAQAVGPRLLLPDAPLRPFSLLRLLEIFEELGPADSRLHGEEPARVE